MDESSTSNPLPKNAESTPTAPLPSPDSSANPLPEDAGHAEPAPTSSTDTQSNPLPKDAKHTDTTPSTITDHEDSNPLPQEQAPKKAPESAAQKDTFMQAASYLPLGIFQFIIALIGLMGNNTKSKFHGAQGIVYWLLFGLGYGVLAALSWVLLLMTPGIGGLAGFGLVVVYALAFGLAVPFYVSFKTFKGKDAVLPVFGRMIAEKVGYSPR